MKKQFCLVLLIGLVFSACSKQELLRSDSDFTGVYNLVLVSGKSIPTNIIHDGVEIVLKSGSFSITSEGKCKSNTVFVPPNGPEITREVNATYTKDGLIITIHWENAGMTIGTMQGNTFTMDNEGIVLLYTK